MKPNFSACSSIFSAPTSIASWAKVVLQDCSIACRKVISSVPQARPSLSTTPESPLVWGSWKVAPPGTRESALSYLPDSSAAAAVTSLNVDPGAIRVWTDRLSNGSPGSSSRSA